MSLSEMHHKRKRREVERAVANMTSKQTRVCKQLEIPPRDYVIVMNKINI
jgi:hypothetical protein